MATVRTRPAEMRRYTTGFELRDVDAGGQFLSARVTTFGQWVDVGPFEEWMEPTVFDTSLARHADDIKLLVEHEHRQVPVGTPVDWEKSDTELVGTWRFGSHEQARAAHTAAQEGMLSTVSIGFLPGRGEEDSRWSEDRRRVVRRRARLLEVSLVSVPANADAQVIAVRTLGPPEQPRPVPLPRLEAARRVLAQERLDW